MKKQFRFIAAVLAVVMCISIMPLTAGATSISDSSVFLKQQSSVTCTLVSSVMMMRRKAILNGDSEWASITEAAVKPTAWSAGLKWTFKYHGMTVETYGMKSDLKLTSKADKKSYFISALTEHPEGIVIYNHSTPHAVLLTRYDSSADTFYCADPAGNIASGEILLKKCYIPGNTQEDVIGNINQIWMITKDTNETASARCDKSHCSSNGVCTDKTCSNYGKIYPYVEIAKSIGVVTTDYAYVQSQPYGDSSYRLRTIPKGTSLFVTASTENIFGMVWYKIANGEWVCSDRCELTQSPPENGNFDGNKTPVLQTKNCYMTVNVGAGSNLRFCSYVSIADEYYIGKIDNGEKVYVYGTTVNKYQDRTWAKISYNGTDGWVNYAWLKEIPAQYGTPDVWLSNDHFDIDLNGDVCRYVSYGYSGDTQYGYYLTLCVEGDSCIDPTWQDGEQIKIQACSEGQATLVVSIVENETERTLDSAKCTVSVTGAKFVPLPSGFEFPILDRMYMESGEYVEFPEVNIYNQGQFADVPANQWYTDSVASAYCFGLMKGNSATTFNPYGNVTLAEAITMAARIHSIYNFGSEDFQQSSGSAWYQCYLDYAYRNGIISYAYYNSDVSYAATRAEYAEIFANALSAEALPAINDIPDGAVPDVPLNAHYAACVYQLYRAGILTGGDARGTFSPETFITRAESAAIVSRMAKSDNRVSFSLS